MQQATVIILLFVIIALGLFMCKLEDGGGYDGGGYYEADW